MKTPDRTPAVGNFHVTSKSLFSHEWCVDSENPTQMHGWGNRHLQTLLLDLREGVNTLGVDEFQRLSE